MDFTNAPAVTSVDVSTFGMFHVKPDYAYRKVYIRGTRTLQIQHLENGHVGENSCSAIARPVPILREQKREPL